MFKNEPDLLTRKQCQDLLHISKSKMLDLIHKDLIFHTQKNLSAIDFPI